MGEVVNLRQARKAKARDTAATLAAANRAKFGRTSGEKARDSAEASRAARLLDGARREEP
ncbi:DUF4169 family protein [Novosphingobium sp. KCTC 2891]|uniref:DUF4169 family protein n=1 Tax=Novosphingobium sp. KCTC 2891 TaxID=2989730 RepID=UPI002223DEA9|nr:DUF4169 family protein [Novosphingobium sp. KCTC 2891]MCW1382909.1 DUF4169 family protein [Novosphingobium sp. KCTC 2891]